MASRGMQDNNNLAHLYLETAVTLFGVKTVPK
jgi:hypothetical protein